MQSQEESRRVRVRERMEDATFLALRPERGHKPRNAGGF